MCVPPVPGRLLILQTLEALQKVKQTSKLLGRGHISLSRFASRVTVDVAAAALTAEHRAFEDLLEGNKKAPEKPGLLSWGTWTRTKNN